jgi:hypothetical protein
MEPVVVVLTVAASAGFGLVAAYATLSIVLLAMKRGFV